MAINPQRELNVTVRAFVDRASFSRAATEVGQIGKGLGDQVTAPLGQVAAASRRAAGDISLLGAQINPGRIIGWASAWTLAYAAIRQFNAGARESVAAALDLDRQMRNVNSIAKLTESQLGGVTGELIRLSTEASAGFRPTQELANALYNINSAGIIGTRSLDVLRAAGAAATAGLTDTETAATALVAVLNAYGLAAKDAGRVSDVLFKTVEVGVPPFKQLADNIGEVASTAAIARVPVEELGLVWAATSRVLTNANLTTTALTRLIISFLQPSEAMAETVRQLGFASASTMLAQLGLVESLKRLHSITGNNSVAIRELFQDQRAFRAASVLMANDLRVLIEAQQDWGRIGAETGATQRALTEQMKSHQAQVDRLRREWERLKLELGQGVLPALASVAAGLANVLEVDRRLRSSVQQTRREWEAIILRRAGLPEQFGLFGRPGVDPFRRTAAEETMRSALAQLEELRRKPVAVPVRLQPEMPLEDLQRLFERHRTLGRFTLPNAIVALAEIVIPRIERELAKARDRAEQLTKALGPSADETKKALTEIKRLEDELLRAESSRIAAARELAGQYRRQGEILANALENLRRVEVAGAEFRLRGIGRDIEAAIAPLQRIRDLFDETIDPRRFQAMRQEIERLTIRRFAQEIETLRRLAVTEPDPMRRAEFGERLQETLARRAATLSQFAEDAARRARESIGRELDRGIGLLERRLARLRIRTELDLLIPDLEQQLGEAEEQIARLRARREALELPLSTEEARRELKDLQDLLSTVEQRAALDPFNTALRQLRGQLRGSIEGIKTRLSEDQGGITKAITKPYQDAAKEIAEIQKNIVDPALQRSQEEARKIASVAREAALGTYNDIVRIWESMGKDAGAAFRRAFLDEIGGIPRGFIQPGPFEAPRPQRRSAIEGPMALPAAAGGVVVHNTYQLGGIDLTDHLSPNAKRELADAVLQALPRHQHFQTMTGGGVFA